MTMTIKPLKISGKICPQGGCDGKPVPGTQVAFRSCGGTVDENGCVECDNIDTSDTPDTLTVVSGSPRFDGGSIQYNPGYCGPFSVFGNIFQTPPIGLTVNDSYACACSMCGRFSCDPPLCNLPLPKVLRLTDSSAGVNCQIGYQHHDINGPFPLFDNWQGTCHGADQGCGKLKKCPPHNYGYGGCTDCGCPTGGGDINYGFGAWLNANSQAVCGVLITWPIKVVENPVYDIFTGEYLGTEWDECNSCPGSVTDPHTKSTSVLGIFTPTIVGCPGNGWTATVRIPDPDEPNTQWTGWCSPAVNIWSQGNEKCCGGTTITITE